MSYRIVAVPSFSRDAKRLSKKYDKSEMDNLPDKELRELIEDIENELNEDEE